MLIACPIRQSRKELARLTQIVPHHLEVAAEAYAVDGAFDVVDQLLDRLGEAVQACEHLAVLLLHRTDATSDR